MSLRLSPLKAFGVIFPTVTVAGYSERSAYLQSENDDGTNPLIVPTRWDSIVGVERPLFSDFRIQAQFMYRYMPHFTPPGDAYASELDPRVKALKTQLAANNAQILNYQERTRPGATLRLGYSNEKNGLDGEVFVMGNFVGADYLLRPKLTYAWTDALKTTIGLDFYGGPQDRPLGALRPYNSLFFEGFYAF